MTLIPLFKVIASIFLVCNKNNGKNGQVNQQASANRPVSSLLGLVRTLQLVVDPS